MNRERLLMVADTIADLPYAQVVWASLEKPRAFNMASGCGSACCVSGWTSEIFHEGQPSGLADSRMLLGLNHDQAQALFSPPGWEHARWDGARAARVLRLLAARDDGVTGAQIRAWWRDPWGGK